jgi:hypothetical protein
MNFKETEVHSSNGLEDPDRNSYDIKPYDFYARCFYDRVLRTTSEAYRDHDYTVATLPSCFTGRSFGRFHPESGDSYLSANNSYDGVGIRTTSVTTTHPVVSTRCQLSDFPISPGNNLSDSGPNAKSLIPALHSVFPLTLTLLPLGFPTTVVLVLPQVRNSDIRSMRTDIQPSHLSGLHLQILIQTHK